MTQKADVPIVLAANQRYVPILYVCICSILQHVSDENMYVIYIFHTDIEEYSQKIFVDTLSKKNIKISFYDVKEKVSGYQLKAKEHISTETFYRFLILDILKQYTKVLYLDCDLIVQKDVAEIYQIDLEDNLIAAAHDPDFIGQCNDSTLLTREYFNTVLKLDSPQNYFQAGVLLLNVEELRKITNIEKLFDLADTGVYKYSDQDILNCICNGRVLYLDMSWNFITDCNRTRWKDVISLAPKEIQDEYKMAQKCPYIVHYAGYLKPWLKPSEDLGYLFWQVARTTVYYEELMVELINNTIDIKMQERKITYRLKDRVKQILHHNTKLKKIVRRLYHRLRQKN